MLRDLNNITKFVNVLTNCKHIYYSILGDINMADVEWMLTSSLRFVRTYFGLRLIVQWI